MDKRQFIENHLEQSRWLANQKQGIVVRSYLLHFSLASVQLLLLCLSYKASGKTVQKQVLSQTGMFWHPIFICRLSLSHTEHRWSCCCCSSTLSWCQGRREEEEEEGGGGGRTPAPKTCIISREMHIIGSVVPNWGEENAGMVPVGSNRWCECIFMNGWGEQVRDNVASSSHHRAIRRKMDIKKLLV